MDSEEKYKLEKTQAAGRPSTDEGAYYHTIHMKGYKGSNRGLLSGIVIGAMVGTAIGVAVAGGVMAITTSFLAWEAIGGIVAAGAAFGMLHGAHKFEQIGIVSGVVSGAADKSEERMKEYEKSIFLELKKEISGLKKAIFKGKGQPEATEAEGPTLVDQVEKKQKEYRTSHCDEHCPPGPKKYMFWKVAGLGTVVGAAAGGLLALTSGAPEYLHHVLGETGKLALSEAQFGAVLTMAGAAIGGSFGINRDLFREISDVTDRWFKGIVVEDKQLSPSPELAKAVAPAADLRMESASAAPKAATPTNEVHTFVIHPHAEDKRITVHKRDWLTREKAHRILLEADSNQVTLQ